MMYSTKFEAHLDILGSSSFGRYVYPSDLFPLRTKHKTLRALGRCRWNIIDALLPDQIPAKILVQVVMLLWEMEPHVRYVFSTCLQFQIFFFVTSFIIVN